MAEFRKPEIKNEDGLVSIQNGTYEQVPNNEALEYIKPLLNIIKANSDFYKFIEGGCEGENDKISEVPDLIRELTTLTTQIGSMVTRVKKANGKVVLPDVEYFKKEFEELNKRIENMPYREAKKIEKQEAQRIAKKFRECTRISIAHNLNEFEFLRDKVHVKFEIDIPVDKVQYMQRIRQDVSNSVLKNENNITNNYKMIRNGELRIDEGKGKV